MGVVTKILYLGLDSPAPLHLRFRMGSHRQALALAVLEAQVCVEAVARTDSAESILTFGEIYLVESSSLFHPSSVLESHCP